MSLDTDSTQATCALTGKNLPIPEGLPEKAVELAAEILVAAQAHQTKQGKAQAAQVARMMDDPKGTAFSFAISDQVLRCRSSKRAANRFRAVVHEYGAPDFVGKSGQAMLTLGATASKWFPQIVMPLVMARMRNESKGVVLPAETAGLSKYLGWRKSTGTRVNINQLGEAVLGEKEAQSRLQANLDHLKNPEINYISAKVSALFSQIDLTAYDETLAAVKERLRLLYRAALASTPHKFVNLDMEAYEDLDLTVDAFQAILDEPEFESLSAGIVLQAYLPDSFAIQQKLTTWARGRKTPIKIRIVKGANLAMETVGAALHDWPIAPYTTKEDSDANFKRMVIFGCQPENAAAVRIGVASHNLFDIAFALLLRDHFGVRDQIEFEMLEGMANDQAAALQEKADGLLNYAPVVAKADFPAAIAYLIRRLDENTSPENFLHDIFAMEPGSPGWDTQKARFLSACKKIPTVSAVPSRTQDRTAPPHPLAKAEFHNAIDTDFALLANRRWLAEVRAKVPHFAGTEVPLHIGGEESTGASWGEGHDPSSPEAVLYRYALGSSTEVQRAFDTAEIAQKSWANLDRSVRSSVLKDAALSIEKNRGDAIAVMITDSGKRATEADVEISEAIDFANYYARTPEFPGFDDGTTPEPIGTVVVVPPWNFPYAIPAGGILAALAAGNAVIFKPAPETTLTAWRLVNHLWEAGISRELLQFLPVPDNEIGQELITDPRAAAVILTGSHATAQLFQGWRPDLHLLAETSGKNSLVVTGNADLDLAANDLVRSAFGHAGQKCSAASLGILESDVYHDAAFRHQLRDAASSLHVGSSHDPRSVVTPLVQPPSPELLRALTTLEPGEEWLLEPTVSPDNPQLWSPGIKLGVKPGSWFHQTECFGPVLGLVCASGLEEAVKIQNATAFGLTGGIHTLDKDEITYWKNHVEVGNAYINRPTTGAIVQRQPFGGWKKSSIGPGAKAGGPNYVAGLSRWSETALPKIHSQVSTDAHPALKPLLEALPQSADRLRIAAQSYTYWWDTEFSVQHDPSQITGEINQFRYRPLTSAHFRANSSTPDEEIALAILASTTCSVPLHISLPEERPFLKSIETSITTSIESEDAFITRIESQQSSLIYASNQLPTAVLRATNAAGLRTSGTPALTNGRLELLRYLKEQAVTETNHRYGRVEPTN